ncbi:hypothetical protein AZE42_01686 [Rhizopogon vesiculosus]|uniref:DUF6533 domain-containing protein n=1 Tax=Rhizopogon vesiculosus TaxID=180088 RepID=A0A1J8QKV5_9AGAM|nr:hypothetical protein AZE42_01686 [Rhizopogon vesiculosus]
MIADSSHSPFTNIDRHVKVIGPTILAYDWLLTIDSEVTHVWSRSWGIVDILYFISRYTPFVDTPIMLIYHFYLVDPSNEACHIALPAQVMLYAIGDTISGQIFMIRTWAVWERSKVVGLVLFTEAVISAVVELYTNAAYANSLTFFQGYNLGGCFVLTSNPIVLVACYLLLANQFTYLVLVVLKTYPTARSERTISRLSNVILQDGVLFYIMLFALVVVNMVFLFQPGITSTVLTVPSRVCQSIFATRIILHIRDVDKSKTIDAFTSTAMRSLMFNDVLGQIEVEMEDQPVRMASAQNQA